MHIKAEYFGPKFEAIRKKDYQKHVHRISEIMSRPPLIHNVINPESARHYVVSKDERTIDSENRRIFDRLI
jgi:hypothetical protein